MSLVREARCVFCTFARTARPTRSFVRNFHAAPKYFSKNPSDPANDLPVVDLGKVEQITEEDLKKHFSPEQQAAIRAAQKVVEQKALEQTGADASPWSLRYVDDLTEIDPVVDKPVRSPWTNTDENTRLKDDDELDTDLYNLMKTLPDDPNAAEEAWQEFDKNMRLTIGREEAERSPRSATTPDLPRTAIKKSSEKKPGDERAQDTEPTPELLRLMQMTGLSRRQISGIKVKTLVSHNVTNQTRLGKISSRYVLTIAGNGNGMIGIGEGKSQDIPEAQIQSQYRAIREMRPIRRYENRTIFGDVKAKVSATELELFARPPGFGLRCQGHIWEVCRAAGISDLAARVTRARNPMNTVKATVQALMSQKDPEEIARARGKKLVDVRKVYYANQV